MSEGNDENRDFYNGYSVDAENQPQGFGDSLTGDRGLSEPLDEGYSPPERWSPGQAFGNTPYEEAVGETFAQRLGQEEAEPDSFDDQGHGYPGLPVGGLRAGHVLAYDPGPGDAISEHRPPGSWLTGDQWGTGNDEYWARQVGGSRSGRLVASDQGTWEDDDADLVAYDVGINGAGASAEEAAVHLIDPDDYWPDR